VDPVMDRCAGELSIRDPNCPWKKGKNLQLRWRISGDREYADVQCIEAQSYDQLAVSANAQNKINEDNDLGLLSVSSAMLLIKAFRCTSVPEHQC
jgi:hypothetical protein